LKVISGTMSADGLLVSEDLSLLKSLALVTATPNGSITTLKNVQEYCAIPVGSQLLFTAVCLFWKPTAKVVSGIQHLSAGVVTAAVAIEVVPILLATFMDTVANYVAMIGGFCVAIVGLIILSHFLQEQGDITEVDLGTVRPEQEKEGTVERKITAWQYFVNVPWLFLAPIAVDNFFNGFLLALTYIYKPYSGLVIAIAFSVETGVLGAVTTATLKSANFPIVVPCIVSIVLCLLLLVGGLIGSVSVSQGSGAVFILFLSFGVASFLYLVTDGLLVEARKKNLQQTG